MAEIRPKKLSGDCGAISYDVITSSMLNEVKPLPGISEFLITYSLIAALKYININDCLGQKKKKARCDQCELGCCRDTALSQGSDRLPDPPVPTSRDCTHPRAKKMYFYCQKCFVGGAGGWSEPPARHPPEPVSARQPRVSAAWWTWCR